MADMTQTQPLVQVKGLKKYFPITQGIILQRKVADVKAVDGLDFEIRKGETLGLVGESGCGKSTTGRAILQLYRPTAGDVIFKGKNLCKLQGEELRKMRRHMQMIFQDPYASLNPRMTVGDIIGEPLEVHNIAKGKEKKERVQEDAPTCSAVAPALGRLPLRSDCRVFSRVGFQRLCHTSCTSCLDLTLSHR